MTRRFGYVGIVLLIIGVIAYFYSSRSESKEVKAFGISLIILGSVFTLSSYIAGGFSSTPPNSSSSPGPGILSSLFGNK